MCVCVCVDDPIKFLCFFLQDHPLQRGDALVDESF